MKTAPLARFNRLLFRFGRRLPVADFDLRALLPDRAEREAIRSKVAAALALLQAHAPVRYHCLRRDLPCLWISATQHVAQCFYDVGICLVQFDYVVSSNTTSEKLALTLAHEGMHARLLRAGFPYHQNVRARIERLCVLTEILVAHRLPASESLVTAARKELDRPAEFWSDAASRARDLQRLGELGPASRIAGHLAAWTARVWGGRGAA
jgi:hypothetical protein